MQDGLNSFYWLDIDADKVHVEQDYTDNFEMAETSMEFYDWSKGKNVIRIYDYEAFKKERFRAA